MRLIPETLKLPNTLNLAAVMKMMQAMRIEDRR